MAKPATLISRQRLYELVWDRPMRDLAAEFEISDVGLAKHCKRANIPIPPRGYFLHKDERKRVRPALPLRFPGATDQIWVGGRHYGYWPQYTEQELLAMEEPEVPTFRESLEELAIRMDRMVGPVRSVKNFDKAFGDISKLLAIDEERRQSSWSYEKPRFDSGPQRRRLLILNALFLALHGLGCRPSMATSKWSLDSPENRSIAVRVGDQHVHFMLEAPDFNPKQRPMKLDNHQLQLSLGHSDSRNSASHIWSDGEGSKLESRLREVVIAILIEAEKEHRATAHRMRDWVIDRKKEILSEIERHKAEQIRLERERREKEEQARVNSLLRQSEDLRKAAIIRDYVAAVTGRMSAASLDRAKLDTWAAWARDVADRLDPTLHMSNFLIFETPPAHE